MWSDSLLLSAARLESEVKSALWISGVIFSCIGLAVLVLLSERNNVHTVREIVVHSQARQFVSTSSDVETCSIYF